MSAAKRTNPVIAAAANPHVDALAALARDYFMPFQVRWIRDEAQLKLYPKSRRIGVTYATSFRAVLKCLRVSGLTQWVSSKDLDLAREFVQTYVRKWCQLANIVASGLGAEDILDLGEDESGKAVTAFQVRFPNGSRIISLSSNPRKFAGKGGDILIDEMDLHPDQGVLYDMARPCIDWGGQLEIVSAYDPDGSTETVFAKLVEEARNGNPKGWSLHQTTIEDAVREGIVERINAEGAKRGRAPQTRESFIERQRKGCRTMDAWLSQYMCQPVNAAGQSAVRPLDLAAAKRDYAIEYRSIEGNARQGDLVDGTVRELYDSSIWPVLRDLYPRVRWSFGLDIARTGHLTAFWIDAWEDGTAFCAAVFTLHNCKFESQETLARRIMRELRAVGRGDSSGLGMQMCESLERDYPGQFSGVNFSADKRRLGTLLMATFEAGVQVVPRSPLCVAADIACIRKTGSLETNRLIFSERPNEHEPASHADMGWACALSKLAHESAGEPMAAVVRPDAQRYEPLHIGRIANPYRTMRVRGQGVIV